jgi:hypothetical protein
MHFEGFPLEIWLRILDYSTSRVRRAISQLSSAFQQVSRKRLYHTLVFGNQVYLGATRETAYDGTWCRDPRLFYKLHKNRHDWKPYVHRVYIQCCKSLAMIVYRRALRRRILAGVRVTVHRLRLASRYAKICHADSYRDAQPLYKIGSIYREL